MVLAAIASLASANERWSAAPLVAWNEQVLAAAEAQDGFMTLKGLRTATMLHLAVHDALASIDGRYMAYAYHATREGADPITAAVQAAYVIASEQYGDQQATWTQLRDQWLPSDTDTAAHQNGLALGNAAAGSRPRPAFPATSLPSHQGDKHAPPWVALRRPDGRRTCRRCAATTGRGFRISKRPYLILNI